MITEREALEESVKLQSHYATLLNQYDGGRRMAFKSADEWMARLDEVEALAAARKRHAAGEATIMDIQMLVSNGEIEAPPKGSMYIDKLDP